MRDVIGDFTRDLERFPGKRCLAREDHRDRVRDFVSRQKQLAITGGGLLLIGLLLWNVFPAVLGVVMFLTGRAECSRMRATGRYWQTRRSVELIGH